MIDFRVLGPLELKGPDGEEILSVLSQPKRIALLAYIALATDGGFRRRDTIIGLFWPDLDQDRARGALRKSLYFLRRSLGEKSLRVRGDEEVALDWSKVTCDAVEFETALEKDDPETALDLYRGDLLEGLFISASSEFEKWLDGERERLRESAATAAWTVAHEYLATGRVTEGERMGQRALALVPTDENEVQRFLEGLNKAGDRAAAIRFYEKFAKELEELLDLQPAAETRALVDEIRSEDGVPVQRPALNEVVQDRVPTDSRADPEPRRTPPPHEGAPPTGRRLKAWAVGTLGTAAIVAGTFFLGKVLGVSSQPPTTDPTDEIVLAVMPFTDLSSGQGDERLSESITVLLDMELDGTPGITRTVDRNALFPRVGERSRETRLPTAEALALAEHFGATHFILGEVIDTGEDEVNLSATVYSTRGASAMELETLSASGSVRELPFLVSALAEQALRALPVPAGVRLSGIATFTSDSPEALEEYLRGDEEFRATRYAEAFESFDQAVDIDPTFALAHYWKSVASVMILRFDDASLAADRAVEHRGRLKNRERRLVEAWNLLIDGSAIEAKTRFQRILRDYPDDVEAHFGLGTVQVYFNPILGESVAEAEDQFLKVLDLSPNFGQAVFHRLEFETRRRDSVAFDTLLAKVDPESDQALAWDAVRAFWLGDEAARWEVRNRIGLSDPKEAGLAVARVAAFLRDYEAAEELADLLTRPNPEPEIQGAAHLLMAMARFGQGRWTDGMASLDASETFSPAWAIELRALFTGFPFRTPAREEIEAVREALEGWAADQQVSSANFVLFAHNGYHGYLRTYLLALNSVWLGNTSEARDYARELAEMPRSDERRAIARSWADGVRARAFLMEGEDSAAVSLLSTPRANVPLWRISISPFFSRAFDRFALGELLMQLDEYDEAMRWFRSLTEGHELVLVAPAYYQMARIEEGRGNRAEATAFYARFAELWANADAEFQPLVEEARAKTSTFSGGS